MKIARVFRHTMFPLCFLLLSCTHKDPGTVGVQFTGIVIDYFTQTPYPGVKVVLHLGTALDPLNGNSFQNERLDSVMTDNAGKYGFSLDKEDDILYKVIPDAPGYLQATVTPEKIARLITADPMTDTLFIGASAPARFVLKNDNPGDSDQVSMVVNYNAPGYLMGVRDIFSTAIIENMGFDPNDFTTVRNYFYDINPSILVDLSVTRYTSGSPVTTKQTNSYPLARQDTTEININY